MLFFLAACTDYNLEQNDKGQTEPEDTGTAPVDTASTTTEPEDTDTVEITEPEDTGPVATEPVYINTGSTLYSYDPATNTATRIGDFMDGGSKVSSMTDTAIDLNGYMYGCAYDELYAIDPNTARVSHVATMDAEFNALTFLSDGRLVGAAEQTVSIVDTSTGRTSPIVRNAGYTSSGDIVGLPDGKLYWSVDGSNDLLVVVDPSNASVTLLGNTGISNLFGMGYAYGELLGFSSTGVVVVLDSTSGSIDSQAPLVGSWWGATTNPVLW